MYCREIVYGYKSLRAGALKYHNMTQSCRHLRTNNAKGTYSSVSRVSATSCVSSFMRIGLVRYLSTPALKALDLASSLVTPVKAQMLVGRRLWLRSCSRILAVDSKPSMTGIF